MKANTKSGTDMLIDERRNHLLALVQRDGRVLVSELSDALGISRITIRKDLDIWSRRGWCSAPMVERSLRRAACFSTPHCRRRSRSN